MEHKPLQPSAEYGKIIVTGERAECPVCHRLLPGVFPPGSTAAGILLRCKRCRNEYQVYTASDLRPDATCVH